MTILTYQSKLVVRVLKSGQIYRAKPNLRLKGEYEALTDMLGLHCECPVFGVVKGKKQNTGGKVSGDFLLTLEVPDGDVHLTEYEEWADFLYAYKFTMPGNYRSLRPDCEEISVRAFHELITSLKTQKPVSEYNYPQVILEKIDPAWLKSVKVAGKSGFLSLFRR